MSVTVTVADYATDADAIRRIRDAVFVMEQRVPSELEHDEEDARAVHVLARAGGSAVGTGRISADGRIGRMAVLASHRGQGVGRLILRALLDVASRAGLRQVYCHAQCHALTFYEDMGFVADGPVFMEADIAHRHMSATVITVTGSRT